MQAKIKSVHSPDVDDLRTYCPQDKKCFCLSLELGIGPNTAHGQEIFTIEVCTPLWFSEILKPKELIFGRHFLIILEYDLDLILDRLKKMVESFEEDSWEKIAIKLSRYAFWEFED